jgi:hypothetical protein
MVDGTEFRWSREGVPIQRRLTFDVATRPTDAVENHSGLKGNYKFDAPDRPEGWEYPADIRHLAGCASGAYVQPACHKIRNKIGSIQ